MKILTVLLLLLATTSVATTATWEETCKNVKDLTMPASDQIPENVKAPEKCDAEALYYGIGAKADPVAARYCAISQVRDEIVFGGNAILMMLYANGIGVTRNFDLAIHHACLVGGAPAEVEARVKHLLDLKAKKWDGRDFDLCDDITSGFMGGHCAAHRARLVSVQRDKRLAAIADKVPAEHKSLFDALLSASDGFVNVRVDNEVDLSGTARSAFQIKERTILNEDFIQMLEAYAKGKGRRYSEKEASELDNKMKQALAAIQKIPAEVQKGWGTVTGQKIETTQKTWEVYRDAFATYASARDKKVTPSSVKAWLTAKRIHMLKSWR
jgi:hypothetical protein